MKKSLTLFFLLLLSLSLVIPALAQEEIEVGDSVDGEADDEVVEYEIELEEGQEIEISVESDDFDTYLTLLDEDGDEVASDDDGGDDLNSLIIYEVEDDGTYTIEVGAFPNGADADGDFELSVEEVGNSSSGDKDDDDDDRDDDDDAELNYDGDWGRDVECEDGDEIEGGVELTIVQQRSGNQYRVTAIGIDGFDPIVAVTLTGNYDDALCNDDDDEAEDYSADLPTTGDVDDSNDSAQVIFNLNSSNAFENVSVVVGGADGDSGEFVLIVEGMFASSADGAGDPMSLWVTPSLQQAGVDPTAYMFSVPNGFDPFIFLSDGNLDPIIDGNGDEVSCDDAGSICWGDSENLSRSFVSRSDGREVEGENLDAMLTIPIDESFLGINLNFIMTRFGSTEGEYVVAFHMGVEEE
ncbi:MAG: PPC domain-containing protein [Chloroflexota bacterium]